MTRSEQLAEAFLKVAEADHYMVGIVVEYTADELDEAEQILIEMENKLKEENTIPSDSIKLALDSIESIKRR